jgi:hypothetical protein
MKVTAEAHSDRPRSSGHPTPWNVRRPAQPASRWALFAVLPVTLQTARKPLTLRVSGTSVTGGEWGHPGIARPPAPSTARHTSSGRAESDRFPRHVPPPEADVGHGGSLPPPAPCAKVSKRQDGVTERQQGHLLTDRAPGRTVMPTPRLDAERHRPLWISLFLIALDLTTMMLFAMSRG